MVKTKVRISKGGKKYIRREKARIRKMAINEEEKEKLIRGLYNNLKHENIKTLK